MVVVYSAGTAQPVELVGRLPGPRHGGAEHPRGVRGHHHARAALRLHREPVLHHAVPLQRHGAQPGERETTILPKY